MMESKRMMGYSFLKKIHGPNKKGLSTVVTTLLIILLSLVSIGIIWVVVKNLIGDATSEISFDTFSLNLGISNAYIDNTTSQVYVAVRRSAGAGNLSGIYFIFHNGTSSTSVKRNIVLKELEEKTFTFTSIEVGGINNVQKVSVSPISKNAGSEVILGITDTFDISTSSGTGGLTCGNGVCEVGETSSSCSQDCSAGGGAVCGNGICESGETSNSCSQDCAAPPSCNGVWQGASEDPGVVCDGGAKCLASCTCPLGFTGDSSGACVSQPSLSSGLVESIWPAGVAKYFDSDDLPKDSTQIVSFIGKYANFSGVGTETRCLQISYAEYLSDPAYNKSYMRLELPSTIMSGDTYNIWLSSTCGA